MKGYVLDASVIIAILLNESKNARKMVNPKTEFHAPELLRYEVANALKSKLLDRLEADKLFSKLFALPLKYHDFGQEQVGAILGMAYETGGTIYDVCYHYLARSLDLTLLTYDKKYFEKAKKLGSIELVS